MDLTALGISPDELRAQIIDKAAEKLLADYAATTDDDDIFSLFDARMKRAIEGKMTEIVDRTARDVVEPRLVAMIESMTFPETNRYGEAQKPPKTWREKLIEMAEGWLGTTVNYNGKTQQEDSYSWRAHSTRVVYMVEKHLQYQIDAAIKAALAEVNTKIAGGIAAAVKISLQETLAGLRVETKIIK